MIRFTFKNDETIQNDGAQPEKGKTAHLLVKSWADDEYADITPAAVVEITPDYAKELLRKLDAARALKEAGGPLSDLDSVTFFDSTPELLDTNEFPTDGMYADPLDEIHTDSLILDEEMLKVLRDTEGVRTDYSRLIVSPMVDEQSDRVYWEMAVKHTSYSVETDGLRRRDLERIAGVK